MHNLFRWPLQLGCFAAVSGAVGRVEDADADAPAAGPTETTDPLAADVPPDAGSQGAEENSDDSDAGEPSQADQPQQ